MPGNKKNISFSVRCFLSFCFLFNPHDNTSLKTRRKTAKGRRLFSKFLLAKKIQ